MIFNYEAAHQIPIIIVFLTFPVNPVSNVLYKHRLTLKYTYKRYTPINGK